MEVLLVTEECRESEAFAACTGETLRGDDADGGDVGLLAPTLDGEAAPGDAGSGGGSANEGIGSGGDDGRSSVL